MDKIGVKFITGTRKRIIGNKKDFFTLIPSKIWFKSGIDSLLRQTDTRQREHHLSYLTHIAASRLTHANLRYKAGHL